MKALKIIAIATICLLAWENYHQYKAAESFNYLKTNVIQLKTMLGASDKNNEQKRYETEKWYVGSNVTNFESHSAVSISSDYSKAQIVMPELREITTWPKDLINVPEDNVDKLGSLYSRMEIIDVRYNLLSVLNIILGLVASIAGIWGFMRGK